MSKQSIKQVHGSNTSQARILAACRTNSGHYSYDLGGEIEVNSCDELEVITDLVGNHFDPDEV